MLKKLFCGTFVEVEKQREEYAYKNTSFDWKVVWISVITAFSLTMIYYFGRYSHFRGFLEAIGTIDLLKTTDIIIYSSNSSNLPELAYWVMMLFVFYFLVPAIVVKLVFKENLSSYGLTFKGAFKDYYLYIIMLLVMVPLVLYFSTTHAFQTKYPFVDFNEGYPIMSDLVKWEFLYCLQFFALEFFFRGFMLHGLKKRMGFYSIFVMMIPYCMIHFGKPVQETLAAIIAGIVLGCVSLKSGSIVLGCLVHMSVGLAMDFASLWQKGLL
ncbi:MAG: CPBP family intramembrane glutamic endopeptidase [Bacteroidia bacterium]